MTFNLRNITQQGLTAAYVVGGAQYQHVVGAGETHSFVADFLLPETDALLRGGLLVNAAGGSPVAEQGIGNGYAMALRLGYKSETRYVPGDVVDFNDAVWVCRLVVQGVTPGTDPGAWSALMGTEEYLPGGFRSVADVSERNAIPSGYRRQGMQVRTLDSNSVYELTGGTANADWSLSGWDTYSLGVVSLKQEGRRRSWYQATAETGAARFQALRKALEEAASYPGQLAVVTLVRGDFDIPAGVPITTYAANNTTIEFSPDSAVIYADELDACDDSRVFPGCVRYAKNFGARAGIPDSQPRLQAALFSAPATGDGTYRPHEYPELETRRCILYLDATSYTLLNPLWITSFVTLEGMVGRESILFGGAGFAPESGPERFVIETATWLPVSTVAAEGANHDLQTGANFSFGIRLWNLVVANGALTGPNANTKLSGIRYGCAQHGAIKVTTVQMGMRGLYLLGNTSHIDVYHWGQGHYGPGPGGTGGMVQRGPTLSGDAVFSCQFFISEEQINNFPVEDHLEYNLGGTMVPLAAVMFNSSHNLRFPIASGEQCGNYAYFKSCHGLHIGQISVFASTTEGNGDTVLTLNNCINSGFDSILGAHYDYAYRVIGFGQSAVAAGAASTFFPAGPFHTMGEPYMSLATDPNTTQIPNGHSRDVRNTVTGRVRRWTNNNGVLEFLQYGTTMTYGT